MKKYIILATLVILLNGCATSSNPLTSDKKDVFGEWGAYLIDSVNQASRTFK